MPLYHIEPEIQDGMRMLPVTQQLFAGSDAPPGVASPLRVSWYGTEVSPIRGSFAMVDSDAGLDDLIGEFIRVLQPDVRRWVIVYVLGSVSGLPAPIALARRPFAAIQLLPLSPTPAYIARIV